MDPSSTFPFRVFDPDDDVWVTERRLPHWEQPGTISFLTWRKWDSIPAPKLSEWIRERSTWLSNHGIDPASPDWRALIERLPKSDRIDFYRVFSERWHALLDNSHGECVLRRPELAEIVAKSLRHFDGDRYELTDFVVMPNHVHVLVAFPGDQRLLDQCEGWKHYTAVQINKRVGRSGRFWQVDGFDHLVRSEAQFIWLRQYIADNPRRAGLHHGEFIHYSREMTKVGDSLRE